MFAALAIWLTSSLIWSRSWLEFLHGFRPLLYIVEALIVTVALMPDLWQLWRRYRHGDDLGANALQRYLLWRLVNVAGIIVVLLITVRLVLPLALTGHRRIVAYRLAPTFGVRIQQLKQRLVDLPLEKPDDILRRERFLAETDEFVLEAAIAGALLEDLNGMPWEIQALRFAVPAAIWMLCIAIALYFLVPFIILGKPIRALLFIFFATLSYCAENKLEKNVPSLFFLPDGSISAFLFVAFLILANTMFFDWLFQETTEKVRQCPFCGREISASDQFCPECGSQQ